MNLPKLPTPEFTITLPISQQLVRYRPFLVKEEKVFLILKESNDQKFILDNILKVMQDCVLNDTQIKDLPYNDFEFLFLNMRVRSIGERVDLEVKCKSCGSPSPVSVDLNDINMGSEDDKINNEIMLSEEIGISCLPRKVKDAANANLVAKQDPIQSVAYFIDKIYTKDQTYNFSELDQKDKNAFIDSLSMKQLTQIMDFVESLPSAKANVKFKCASCGADNDYTIEGIDNFFT